MSAKPRLQNVQQGGDLEKQQDSDVTAEMLDRGQVEDLICI